jgi:hypothetical protein
MSKQAKSLVCNECGLQMRSAQAATSHAMSTGHTDFAESVEAVREIVCATCGKPCQSDVEVEQHKRATGHSDFKDNTKHDAGPVEMSLGGATDDTPPSTGEKEGSRKINGSIFTQVCEFGFSAARVKHALLAGCTTVESAVSWLTAPDKMDDASLDVEPDNVEIDNTPPKAPMTEAERLQKVEEMKQRLHEKKLQKAAEDQAAAIAKDKERIANQKALAESRVLAEEHKRKLAYEQMKREKEADRKAKEKILIELAVDKAIKQGQDAVKARADIVAEFERKHREAEEAKRDAYLKQPEVQQTQSSVSATDWKLGVSNEVATVPLSDNVAIAQRVPLPTPSKESFSDIAKTIPLEKRDGIKSILRNILQSPLDGKIRKLKIHNGAVGRAIPTPECVNYLRLSGFKLEGDELRMNSVIMRRVVLAVGGLESA